MSSLHASAADEQRFDEALATIHRTSPLWAVQLSNHAPMAAEALTRHGLTDTLAPFLDAYGKNLDPWSLPAPAQLADWRAMLGRREALDSLVGHAIAEGDVTDVVRDALPTLSEGILGAALHGSLRLAHALRSYRRVPSAIRRDEIAVALGYWAAEYALVEGRPGTAAEPLDAVKALRAVPALPAELWVDGIITTRAQACSQSPDYLAAVARCDVKAMSVEDSIRGLCLLAAELVLSAPGRRTRFAYLHAVTGTNALRSWIELLTPEQQQQALAWHWRALAAIHCMCRGTPLPAEPDVGPAPMAPLGTPEELLHRAAASLDDHAIKLAAAVVEEHQLHPNDTLLRAAWHMLT